jgi:hypothetical protein
VEAFLRGETGGSGTSRGTRASSCRAGLESRQPFGLPTAAIPPNVAWRASVSPGTRTSFRRPWMTASACRWCRPVVASLVAVAEQSRRDRVAVGLVVDIKMRRSASRACGSSVSRMARSSAMLGAYELLRPPAPSRVSARMYPRSAAGRGARLRCGGRPWIRLIIETFSVGLAEIDGPGVRRHRACDPCLSNPRPLGPPPW